MDIKQNTLRSNGGKESIWREKYLESLDAQEKESAQQQETINTLRRGLLSVSLVGDGIDKDLDTSLASLRKQLHKLDQQAELNNLLRVIEEKLLDLDNQKIQKADGMLTLLDVAALNLGKLQFAQSHKRAVRRFTRKLKKPGDTPQAQLVLLEDFIQLCVSIFSNLLEHDKPATVGFWQKLFGKQPLPPVPKSNPTNQPTLDIGDSPEHAAEQSLPDSIKSVTNPIAEQPNFDTAQASKSADTASSSETLDQAKASQMSKADTEGMIKEFIYQLLDNIGSADAIRAVASQLRAKLLTSRDEELKNCLTQIHNLMNLASANERNSFRKYLEELSDSVAQLSKFIGNTKGHSEALKKLDTRVDKDLRLRLSSINTDIETVTDLSDMKASLKNQLDGMVVTMDEAKLQKSKAEADYNKQMDTLAKKFEAVESESKLLKQAMENQRKAMEIDSLTSLPNRFAFNERLKKELETLSVTSDPICLCIGDVDEFEQLNKRFGLNAGDKALQLITKQMQKRLGSDDFLARYSADKFVIIMPLNPMAEGLKTIQDICSTIRNAPFKCKNESISITLSFGITELVRSDEDDSAFKRASEALLSAKNAGGDDCYSITAA